MRYTLAASLTLLASVAVAQEQPNTVLVMDGSGSMWGQVDGVAKITIAQDVVGTLLSEFPDDQGLGLTVYGHRARGECTDIETVVPPAPGTAGQIADAVNAIKPLGKTPMTDAVIAAAQALRYTEDKATVILVSDGVETCNPDPCAAARLLEEAGIDFTAHVIGFDVGADAEALAQMQCIAEETGGQFLTADTADQLTEALSQVAVAVPEPEPEPALVPTTLRAVIEGKDVLVDGPVLWDLSDNSGPVESGVEGNPLELELVEGSYVATAYSTSLETGLNRQFVAIGDAATIEIAFPEPAETARVLAPAEAVAGSMIEVGWNGPNTAGDYIGIGPADADGAEMWRNWVLTSDGNPVSLRVPPLPGPHVIQYFKGGTRESLGTTEIAVTPVQVTLDAPTQAAAGSLIEVAWTGPNYREDYIGIGLVGADGADTWDNWVYTSEGSPAKLRVPPEPGEYEITYFMAQGRTPVETIAFSADEIETAILAPDEAVAGSTIDVGWTGPDYPEDYIGIGPVDAEGAKTWDNWQYTRDGNPARLTMPPEPGDYLITYFQRQDRTPMASKPITLTAIGASVTAPPDAEAGSTIEVSWTGPDYKDDYIGIGRVDATGGALWENWTYTREGSPLKLLMPTEPGDYLITYFQRQDRAPLVSVPITLKPLEASVSAPAEAIAGSTIEVTWSGPDYKDDYIGIGRADATGGSQWENWVATGDGNPARLLVPTTPGDYRVTYFQRQDRSPLTHTTLVVTPPEVSLSAPTEAVAGSQIAVEWIGPDYKEDYIGVGRTDATGGAQWETWVYTREGNPAQVTAPSTAGDYVISYFLRQDRSKAVGVPLTVIAPQSRILAPATAKAGATIDIGWEGPDYKEDYIGIGLENATGGRQWQSWVYTRDGNPARVTLPDTPGTYKIRYFMRLNRTPLSEATITLE